MNVLSARDLDLRPMLPMPVPSLMMSQLQLLIYRSRLPCLPISCVLRIRINYCT
uniref:Uncharacterized protein n=2 Tax=Picea TaxID=3328 RepID=A0A101LW11_PICGL|nr:hypothetical protein ABT39_MTgene1490 [Picea glauca]QHR92661.1 hypothetical protein Q903MT_gene6709 [Picea sitchensis]